MNLMKNYFWSVLFALPFLYTSCKQEKVQEKTKEPTAQEAVFQFKTNLYKNAVDSVFKKYDFNASIGVFEDSILVYRKNNGFENFKSQTPISDASIFPIASISKQFTAVLILKKAEKGVLSIQDPVSKYLPSFNQGEKAKITVEQLMNHTSGIGDAATNLVSKPGAEFNYSNKGFRYLGEILEKATGKTYSQNASELFKEVGLNSTFTADQFSGGNFASAYTGSLKTAQEVAGMPNRLADESISIPAGGILSTIDDLHLWNQKLYGMKIINAESLKKFQKQTAERNHQILGKMGYGYGIMMSRTEPVSYFHSGYIKGAPSLNVYYPKTKTSVIILSNFANEGLGKNAIFQPHKAIKAASDIIQSATPEWSVN